MDVEVDRLSSLQNDLIYKILSYVDIVYSIRLSVLSSRWRFIWTSMPDLNFSSHEVSGSSPYYKFVNNVLSRRNIQKDVSSVSLMWSHNGVSVKSILEYAFSHNVQQMTIQLINYSEFLYPLLRSKSLKHLTITRDSDMNWHPSYSPWDLPALTTLHLHRVRLFSCSYILTMCQNLKNLTLDGCEVREREDPNGFIINNPRLLNLTLNEVKWYVDFVYVDTPQLKNLIIVHVNAPKWSHCGSEFPWKLRISARDLTYFLLKGSHFPELSLDGFRSLEKVDLLISSPHKTDVKKICELLQRVHSVKSLALSLEIVELLSSSVEVISYQPSPFASLKSLKIYPLMNIEIYPDLLDQEQAAMDINLSTEVKSYLLDASPNATFTLISREEARAIKTTKDAQRRMANLWNYLEETKANIKTGRADVEGLADYSYYDCKIRPRGGEHSKIVSSLHHIKELLTNVLTSKRVEMQEQYSRLCAEAEPVVYNLIDDMKHQCDIQRSICGEYFEFFFH